MGIKSFIKNNKVISPVAWKMFCSKQAKTMYKNNKALCDRLLKFKDTKKGQRCFIIGTGPSLTASDLDVLKAHNIDCFGTHRIFTTFEKTDWRPTYYVAQDHALINEIKNDIKEIDCNIKILPADFVDVFGIGEEYNYYVLREYADSKDKIHFSKNANKFISQGFTVAYASVQLAVFMGYSEIYFLGVDHNYSAFMDKDGNIVSDDKVKDYFGNQKIQGKNLPRLDDSSRGYLKAKQYADKNGVKIFNATRGGKLEIFPRVDLDEILKEEKIKN